MFKKTDVAKTAAALAALMATAAHAQDPTTPPTEGGASGGDMTEIVITGVRASLERAMDIKRESTGVVDAISAEDMGKFPDTNLAESLQRITGVSIERRDGEGASVTIRGFGGGNNLVLLNGRMMPSADQYAGSSGAGGSEGGSTRSFNFANLASEAVAGIEVYKTGRASVATGGIGGTIDIKTTRPLEQPGTRASLGAKAVTDTTNKYGDDVTPELSGIFSWTNPDETFGASLSASYQERDSGAAGATVNDWNIGVWGEDSLYSMAPGAEVVNAPEDGQLYARPNDLRYSWSDRHRERTNAQLTLQFKPMDDLTLTGDYTYAENHLQEARSEQGIWFANNTSATYIEFDDGSVATPTVYAEEGSLSGKDMGHEQQWRDQTNTLKSLGFNAAWQAMDRLSLTLDAHHSKMDSLPTGPGKAGEVAVSIAGSALTGQTAYYNNGLPIMATTQAGGEEGFYNSVGSQIGRIWYAAQTTKVDQIQLDAAWQFDRGQFDFGIDHQIVESNQQQSVNQMTFGDWGVSDAGQIPDELLEHFNYAAQFDDYNTSGAQQYGVRGDAVALAQWGVDTYGTAANGYAVAYNPDLAVDATVKEEITAGFFQVSMPGELGNFPTNLVMGLRYEKTNVTSSTRYIVPDYLLWQDNNDFFVQRTADPTLLKAKSDYDNMLPSMDFDINLRDDVKARFSFSKTISRPDRTQLTPAVADFGRVGSTYNGTVATASQGNPDLVPLESNNVDLSFEWYYSDSSYASIGFFEKRVSNFIGTDQVLETHFDIRDQTNGPRAYAAADALQNMGVSVDDTSLFVMMAVLEHPEAYPNGAADFKSANGVVDPQFAVQVATDYDITPNSDDPLMEFSTTTPVNTKDAKLYGTELAVQHFFGDSGFGLLANYTIVRGDVGFKNTGLPSVSQFALTGLSDTANVVGIYEKYGFSARVAYNYRSSYLTQTNKGNSRNPVYVAPYEQIDFNLAYTFNEHLTVSLEGLNVTGENLRQYGRSKAQLWYLQDLGARYQVGLRYNF